MPSVPVSHMPIWAPLLLLAYPLLERIALALWRKR
jgi:hypothetical protein